MPLMKADARQIPLRDETVQCVVTSPPYWGLRDYGVEGQLGLAVEAMKGFAAAGCPVCGAYGNDVLCGAPKNKEVRNE